ncbi:hypothetical protein [Cribrihabitans neustonicus]|uniref:hypothetical protein n=1 Tax=Cribrihabitans neustonicus TaxID=1429085 RepID=UPI003B58CBD3
MFEIPGPVTAMAYALLTAWNTGHVTNGFSLLLMPALLFAGWAVIDRRWSFLYLLSGDQADPLRAEEGPGQPGQQA